MYWLVLISGWAFALSITSGLSQFLESGIFEFEGCCRWFAKRFLHPDFVEPYDFIFIWDEDLDLRHFNAER